MENDGIEEKIKELICSQIKSCKNRMKRLRMKSRRPEDGDGLIREIKFRMQRFCKALAVLDTPGPTLIEENRWLKTEKKEGKEELRALKLSRQSEESQPTPTLIEENHWLKTEMKEVKEELRALKLSRQFKESQPTPTLIEENHWLKTEMNEVKEELRALKLARQSEESQSTSTLIDENRWLKTELKEVKEELRALKLSRQIGERPRTRLTDLKSVKEYLSDLLAGEKELRVHEVEQKRCCPDLIEKNRWLLEVLEFLLEELRSIKEMELKRTDVKKWRRRFKKYEKKC